MFQLIAPQAGFFWSSFKCNNLKRVSSTEIAAVFTLHSHKSRNQLYSEKKGLRARPTFSCPATDHGKKHEDSAIKAFLERAIVPADWILKKPGVISENRISCSPDAMFVHREMDVLFGLEVKCPFSKPIPTRKEEIQPEYLFQCFTCLMLSQADRWFLAYYHAGSARLRVFEMRPDPALWNDTIVPRVERFLEQVRDGPDAPPFGRKNKEEKAEAEALRQKLLGLMEERRDLSGVDDDTYQ